VREREREIVGEEVPDGWRWWPSDDSDVASHPFITSEEKEREKG